MPEISRIDLSKYRLNKAWEMLLSANRDLNAEDYASANNRAYYAVFHCMRAILATDSEDYKKHSAVISRFSVNYLKSEILPRDFGKLIANASLIRNRSDYEDFLSALSPTQRHSFTEQMSFTTLLKSILGQHRIMRQEQMRYCLRTERWN